MKKLGIILNLYQPVTRDEKELREIADSSYLPLIKTIKNRKDVRVTLNTPLGLLQQMDELGYSAWIKDIKALAEEDRVEIVGSAAYNAFLPGLPEPLLSSQIILNEYALGYFFGRRSGFEGESAVLVKGLKGFVAPGNFLNTETLGLLQEFGYSWVLSGENSVNGKRGMLKLKNNDCHMLSFNPELSNVINSRENMEVSDILENIGSGEDCVCLLDAEVFGHKNKDGVYLLNKILEGLSQQDVEVITAGEFVEGELEESRFVEIDELVSGSDKEKLFNSPLLEINSFFVDSVAGQLGDLPRIEEEGMENIPVWAQDLPDAIRIPVLAAQLCDMEQFSDKFMQKYLALYAEFANLTDSSELKDKLSSVTQS